MEKPCLNDQNVFPDDEVLQHHLGETKIAWDHFSAMLTNEYPAITPEWRYYRDGNNWLYKVTKKTKTICWVSIWPGKFKTTFYFGDKAEDLIRNSGLNKELIDQFVNGTRYGKIRGITVEVRKPLDLEATKLLITIKEQLK